MSALALQVLGPPAVAHNGRSLPFPTRKTLALLVYLAVEGGRQPRESLAGLLWPDSEPRRANASLRNTLARLRHALGTAQAVLVVGEHQVGLAPNASLTIDARALEMDESHASVEQLQAALALYRGEFLQGFSLPDALGFDDWLSIQRERVHRRVSVLLDRLSRVQTDAGQPRAGLETAVRWVGHDLLSEAACRRVMQLHWALGNPAAALQAYAACQANLTRELAVEPAPETLALAERIRRHVPAGRPARVAALSPLHSELPFVGRAAPHSQLVTAYHAARQGRTQTVVLSGEAGIGKTRLSAEFLHWAEAQGADVLRGRAFEAGGRLPYQALVDALRTRLEREHAPDDLLADVWLAELSRLLPELRERYPDLPAPTADDALARTRLPEAVTRLGQALAGHAPLVLFLDDVQWADSATLDTVAYSLGRWAEANLPVLCLLAVRAEALATALVLRDWLGQLERGMPLNRIMLGSISAVETRQLVETLGPSNDPHAVQHFAGWLFAETAGQPFFIAETLKALSERGVLAVQSARQAELDLGGATRWLESGSEPSLLPSGVRELIIARFSRLGAAAADLLTAAAVLGHDCTFEQMCAVAGASEAANLSPLDELLASQVLSRGPQEALPYVVAHDKIRDVVYTEAGDARRRLYHRRALEWLAGDSPRAPAAELAHHALRARLPEPAFRYSIEAGDAAMQLFAVQDALDAYEQARQVARGQPPLETGSQAQHLYTRLGRAYELRGAHAQAEAVYTEMLARARESTLAAMECAALNHLAALAVRGYAFARARALLEEALHVAERTNDRSAQAETEWGLAQLAHHQFDFRSSHRHSERTLALARKLQNSELTAGSLNTLAYASMLLGDVKSGDLQMEEACALFHQLGNRALEADCLTAMSAARLWLGRLADSVASAQAAHATCREIENPWGEIYSGIWLATGLLDRGEYDAALEVALEGKQLASTHGFKPIGLFNAILRAQVFRTLGSWAEGSAALVEAAALNEQAQVSGFASAILAERCAYAALVGQWPGARRHAAAFVAARSYTTLPLLLPPQVFITEALATGNDDLAIDDARRWSGLVASIPRFRIGHLRSFAALALPRFLSRTHPADLSGSDQAITYLEEASDLAAMLGLPGETWQIQAALSGLFRATDRESDAGRSFASASAIVESLAGSMGDERRRSAFREHAAGMLHAAQRDIHAA